MSVKSFLCTKFNAFAYATILSATLAITAFVADKAYNHFLEPSPDRNDFRTTQLTTMADGHKAISNVFGVVAAIGATMTTAIYFMKKHDGQRTPVI